MDKDENHSYNVNEKKTENQSISMNEKENENAVIIASRENRNTSLGRLLKSVLIDCISDTSVTGPPNIIKDNLHIGI